jgi:hypothetical protein
MHVLAAAPKVEIAVKQSLKALLLADASHVEK